MQDSIVKSKWYSSVIDTHTPGDSLSEDFYTSCWARESKEFLGLPSENVKNSKHVSCYLEATEVRNNLH